MAPESNERTTLNAMLRLTRMGGFFSFDEGICIALDGPFWSSK